MSAKLASDLSQRHTTRLPEGELSQNSFSRRGSFIPNVETKTSAAPTPNVTSKSTDVATMVLKILRDERARHSS